MKFLLSLALAGVALAQNARIGLPAEGQRLARGSNVVVQVQRPVCLYLRLFSFSFFPKLIEILELPDGIQGNGRRHWHQPLQQRPVSSSHRCPRHGAVQRPVQPGLP